MRIETLVHRFYCRDCVVDNTKISEGTKIAIEDIDEDLLM
jgi:Zn finger protein HypA/HybF involved in hydrogenase expression